MTVMQCLVYGLSWVLTALYFFLATMTATIAMMAMAARTQPMMIPIVAQLLPPSVPQVSNPSSNSAFLSSCKCHSILYTASKLELYSYVFSKHCYHSSTSFHSQETTSHILVPSRL